MKHSQKLVDQAHDLAFNGELSNKAIAKKLKLTDNQLNYILYQRTQKNSDPFVSLHAVLTSGLKPKKEPTITESFLDFFISEDFK